MDGVQQQEKMDVVGTHEMMDGHDAARKEWMVLIQQKKGMVLVQQEQRDGAGAAKIDG